MRRKASGSYDMFGNYSGQTERVFANAYKQVKSINRIGKHVIARNKPGHYVTQGINKNPSLYGQQTGPYRFEKRNKYYQRK